MIILEIIIFAIIYVAIGGFIAGLIHVEEDDDGFGLFVVFFWPIVLVTAIIWLVTKLPMRAGNRVRELFERRTMKED